MLDFPSQNSITEFVKNKYDQYIILNVLQMQNSVWTEFLN